MTEIQTVAHCRRCIHRDARKRPDWSSLRGDDVGLCIQSWRCVRVAGNLEVENGGRKQHRRCKDATSSLRQAGILGTNSPWMAFWSCEFSIYNISVVYLMPWHQLSAVFRELERIWWASLAASKRKRYGTIKVISTNRSSPEPPSKAPYNFGISADWYNKHKESYADWISDWYQYDDIEGFGSKTTQLPRDGMAPVDGHEGGSSNEELYDWWPRCISSRDGFVYLILSRHGLIDGLSDETVFLDAFECCWLNTCSFCSINILVVLPCV